MLDGGTPQVFSALTYLPAQDKSSAGAIEKYQLLVSTDLKSWTEVAAGEFANIKANPILQRIALAKPVTARYIKLVALQAVPDKQGKSVVRTAEIAVYH
jgi:alpha-L-fucosidase